MIDAGVGIASTPDLLTADDSVGDSNSDNITNKTQVTFTGQAAQTIRDNNGNNVEAVVTAEDGVTVRLFNGNATIGF